MKAQDGYFSCHKFLLNRNIIGDYYSIFFSLHFHVRRYKGNCKSSLCSHVSECLQDTSPLSYPPRYPGGRPTLLSTTTTTLEIFDKRLANGVLLLLL